MEGTHLLVTPLELRMSRMLPARLRDPGSLPSADWGGPALSIAVVGRCDSLGGLDGGLAVKRLLALVGALHVIVIVIVVVVVVVATSIWCRSDLLAFRCSDRLRRRSRLLGRLGGSSSLGLGRCLELLCSRRRSRLLGHWRGLFLGALAAEIIVAVHVFLLARLLARLLLARFLLLALLALLFTLRHTRIVLLICDDLLFACRCPGLRGHQLLLLLRIVVHSNAAEVLHRLDER